MPVSKYADRLNKMKTAFKQAKNASASMFGDLKLEDGSYMAQISGASFHEKKATNELMIRVAYLIIEGEYQGSIQYAYLKFDSEFDNEQQIPFTVRWVNLMGYEWPDENPADLEEILEEIAESKPTCKIEVSNGFISLVECLDDTEQPEETEPADIPETPEEEIEEAPPPKRKAPKRKAQPEPEPEPEPEEPAITTEELFTFCEAWSIKTDSNDDIEALTERIKDSQFEEDDLEDEDINVLTILELIDDPEVVMRKKKKKGRK